LNFLYDNFIADFFLRVFNWLGAFFNDYAIAIIILTVAIRVAMIPLDIKQKKSSREMAKIQPQLNELRKRYANDQQALQRETSALQKKHNVNPMAGCLPMLIQLPIFFAFFGSLRVLASDQTISVIMEALNNGAASVDLPKWLWVNNIWQPDSGFVSILPQGEGFLKFLQQNMQYIAPQKMALLQSQGMLDFSGSQLAVTSAYDQLTEAIISANGKAMHNNGWFILPILAGASLFIQQMITQKMNPSMSEQQGGKMMLYFFPIFSVYICIISNAAFAIYWVVANIYALAQLIVVNKLLDKKELKEKEHVIVR